MFHLAGRACGLLLEAAGDAPPIWRHFGVRLADPGAAWPGQGARPLPPSTLSGDPALDVLPTHGFGWFGQPALAGSRPAAGGDRHWAHRFALADARQQGDTLRLTLVDTAAALAVTVEYTLDPESDVLSAWAEVENRGDAPFRLDWLAAACVPLPPEADRLLAFHGRWTLEFQESREHLGVGTWRRDGRRGRTSHESFPGVIVGPELGDDAGPVWGAHLGWSGNHTLLIEPMSDRRRQLQLGEWLAPGEVLVAPGERYRTPTAYLSWSDGGLNGLAGNFHRFMRRRVLNWPGGAMAPRPVHLNTWEAVYFDHRLDGLKALASAGAEVGAERFVLDDGWFHRRDHDRAALGDWWPDERKYPHGLTPLIEHVRGLGLQFGLWVEPEMVNPDSDLYRAHPDWALHLDERPLVVGRNQLVLDLARAEVSDYLFDKLDGLLGEYPISYLKWDMNRDLATAGHGGRAAYRRQVEALYALLGRLRAAHPAVEIESCASGGARVDYGILAHTHRVWTSDCNDALTRIGIQRGFLRFFPPEIMGAHIGPDHSHTTGRRHTLAFRAAVALFGHLGLEQDVRTLDAAARSDLARWISLYKQWRGLLHGGSLRQGARGGLSWQYVSTPDGAACLCAVYRLREEDLRYTPPLRLAGLDPGRDYRIEALGVPEVPHSTTSSELLDALAQGRLVLSGATLRELGLPLPPLPPESAIVVALTRTGQ